MKIGIYTITNLVNNKMYVGSTQETKDNMSKAHLSRVVYRATPIIQYSLEGIKLKEFRTITEATKQGNNWSTSSISKCCKGKLNKAYGYIWKYKNI